MGKSTMNEAKARQHARHRLKYQVQYLRTQQHKLDSAAKEKEKSEKRGRFGYIIEGTYGNVRIVECMEPTVGAVTMKTALRWYREMSGYRNQLQAA